MNYLTRRTGSTSFYYREATPSDVRAVIEARGVKAKREVWISLRTPSHSEAKVRLPAVRAEQHRKWELLRSEGSATDGQPTAQDLIEATVEFVHERFVEVARADLRQKLSDGADILSEKERRKTQLVTASLLPNETDNVAMQSLAAAMCREKGWKLSGQADGTGSQFPQLVQIVKKAIQYARGTVVAMLDGEQRLPSSQEVMVHLGSVKHKRASEGEAILQLFELYEADSTREGKSPDTLLTERKILEHFSGFVGKSRDVRDIQRSDVRDFKRALLQVPHRWAVRAELRGLSLRGASQKWRETGGAVRSARTVNREISAVSSFFVWLEDEGYVDDNIAVGMRSKINKAATRYPPYSFDQLRVVFSSPLFSTCSKLNEHLEGDSEVRDWRFWLPICALFSGARTGELAQLFCSDIRDDRGVWVFDINESDRGGVKKLKTKSSTRIVPIHQSLIELGFLDHVSAVNAKGHAALFPELKPGPRGDMSYHPSKFWQKYLKRLGFAGTRLCMHSFRHTFADECRRGGVDEGVLKALLGHSDNSTTGGYGTIPLGNLMQRREAIEALSFDGLAIGKNTARQLIKLTVSTNP